MFADWKQNDIVVRGAHFNYYRAPGLPQSGKPVLVLQHGFSDNGRCWGPVAQELAADYDVILPEARAHGHSARVMPGEDVDQAADLAALLDALGVSTALVGGHSMGAQIAADLAGRFPRLVRAIVLEDPPWFKPNPQAEARPAERPEESSFNQWFISQQQKSLEQIIAECRQQHPTWPEAYARPWCEGKHELDLTYLRRARRPSNWQALVPTIQCPALLITAEPRLGGIVTPEVAQEVTALNPNFRVINFPGAGHHVRFAEHAAYMQALKSYLCEVA